VNGVTLTITDSDPGTDDGGEGESLRFCPDTPVTRAQMASFLTRALKLPT